MQYTTLGTTGLRVSVAGLGCGGSSRLGSAWGKSEAECVGLVRHAIDLGVNFLDTAAAYDTEAIVGKAISEVPRDRVVVATKARIRHEGRPLSAAEVIESLDRSLRALRTDHIDVFQLHGVPPAAYDHVMAQLVPPLLAEQAKGKFRHLGITETAPNDPRHLMLQRAVHDECWQVVMLAFHMMNQNARATVFPHTLEPHRHAAGVRRAQPVQRAGAPAGGHAGTGRRRPRARLARRARAAARLPDPRRYHERDRCRLPLCPPRAWRRRRAVRHG
jgi:aryl-alcohol dehydrogenase-like predicted oxidoreductase